MIEVLLKLIHIVNLTTIKKCLQDISNKILQFDSVVQPGRIICKNKPQMN